MFFFTRVEEVDEPQTSPRGLVKQPISVLSVSMGQTGRWGRRSRRRKNGEKEMMMRRKKEGWVFSSYDHFMDTFNRRRRSSPEVMHLERFCIFTHLLCFFRNAKILGQKKNKTKRGTGPNRRRNDVTKRKENAVKTLHFNGKTRSWGNVFSLHLVSSSVI